MDEAVLLRESLKGNPHHAAFFVVDIVSALNIDDFSVFYTLAKWI
jgi:hypothetical protein